MHHDEAPTAEPPTLSMRLHDETADVHDAAERAPFITNLLEGGLTIDAYVLLLAQYLPVYRALETTAARYRYDPVIGDLVPAALDRAAAIEHDLRVLGGDAADAIEPTAATADYVARITETSADWPGGFVAHHYVRYLGDLSGGQIIRRILSRHYGLTDDRGLSFYVFDDIDNGVQFKKRYRAALDRAPWGPAEQDRIVEEARRAFEHNLAVFASLDGSAAALAGAGGPADI
ncbi:MAG: heme oxygenase (biliverdin-producing) [Acidimicrobiales bacterium]